jgi:hypothetical protein
VHPPKLCPPPPRYFKDSTDGLANSLAPFMYEYKDQLQAVADVRAGKLAAYVGDWPVLKGYTMEPPCNLMVSDETFGPGALVFGLHRNADLLGDLNVGLLALSEVRPGGREAGAGVSLVGRRRAWVGSLCAGAAGREPVAGLL